MTHKRILFFFILAGLILAAVLGFYFYRSNLGPTHEAMEDLLQEFAADTQIDEIQSFAQIIAVSKRTQGEITTIIDHTAQLLQEKIEMKQELIVLLAKKKTEQRIMNLMPFLVIGMLTTVSPEYMAPLYGTLNGRIVMTVCILLAGGSIWMSKVFSEIRV